MCARDGRYYGEATAEALTFVGLVPVAGALFWAYLAGVARLLRWKGFLAVLVIPPTFFVMAVLAALPASSATQWAITAVLLLAVFVAWTVREYGHKWVGSSGRR